MLLNIELWTIIRDGIEAKTKRNRGTIMTAQQYQSAASYWTSKSHVEMPAAELKQCTEEFITTHSVCALATGAGDYVRCTT